MSCTVLRSTFRDFLADDCPQLAAALSYYAVFSLPPLLMIVISIAGMLAPRDEVRGEVTSQIETFFGGDAAEQITSMADYASVSGKSTAGLLIGLAVLIFGATGLMAQLQVALNRVWGVRPDPERGGIKPFLLKRVISLGMVFGLAFLLLISLTVSAALSAIGERINELLPANLSSYVPLISHYATSFVVTATLFAAIYKWLPDAKIRWRDVAVGALATTVLFLIGKFTLGNYFGKANLGSTYDAAGSLALVLIWVYYSGIIVLLGAEFTHNWAIQRGRKVLPVSGAVCVRRKIERVDDGGCHDTS